MIIASTDRQTRSAHRRLSNTTHHDYTGAEDQEHFAPISSRLDTFSRLTRTDIEVRSEVISMEEDAGASQPCMWCCHCEDRR